MAPIPEYSLGATFACLKARDVAVSYHLDDSDYFVFDPIARAVGGGVVVWSGPPTDPLAARIDECVA